MDKLRYLAIKRAVLLSGLICVTRFFLVVCEMVDGFGERRMLFSVNATV
jgi:hypothetical protein